MKFLFLSTATLATLYLSARDYFAHEALANVNYQSLERIVYFPLVLSLSFSLSLSLSLAFPLTPNFH